MKNTLRAAVAALELRDGLLVLVKGARGVHHAGTGCGPGTEVEVHVTRLEEVKVCGQCSWEAVVVKRDAYAHGHQESTLARLAAVKDGAGGMEDLDALLHLRGFQASRDSGEGAMRGWAAEVARDLMGPRAGEFTAWVTSVLVTEALRPARLLGASAQADVLAEALTQELFEDQGWVLVEMHPMWHLKGVLGLVTRACVLDSTRCTALVPAVVAKALEASSYLSGAAQLASSHSVGPDPLSGAVEAFKVLHSSDPWSRRGRSGTETLEGAWEVAVAL